MPTITYKFHVEGMHCSGCSGNLEKRLGKMPGVVRASVSLLMKRADVECDSDAVTPQKILDTIETTGFEGEQITDEKEESGAEDDEETHASGHSDERTRYRRRFWLSLAWLVPLVVPGMAAMFGVPGFHWLHAPEHALSFATLQCVLTLAIVWINREYFQVGLRLLVRGMPNMDSLVSLGATAAVVYSLVLYAVMIHDALSSVPPKFGAMDLYFESAATILTIITLGRWLESISRGRTSHALAELVRLAPDTATVERDGVESVVKSEQVRTGDTVIVRPGQRVPVDGTVVEGASTLDASALTGESMPVVKTVGDSLMTAMINQDGWLKMKAERVGRDTTLAKIVALVRETAASKAPIARIADRVCGVFVSTVIAIALITCVVWLLVGSSISFALSMTIAVLVISCPCALGLATPLAIMVGTGRGARDGILVKSAAAFERLARIDTVVLDKTGTVTAGHPAITETAATNGNERELLQIAGTLENFSRHPLARAVAERVGADSIPLLEAREFAGIPGRGIVATVDGVLCRVGNRDMMEESGIDLSSAREDDERLAREGRTVLFVARGETLLGTVAVSDPIKPGSADAVHELKRRGIGTVLLSGDRKETAEAVGRAIGVDRVVAEVLPADKERVVRELCEQGKRVAMVGDGINDAAALARADVGMAVGAGTDIAIESADLVLMKDDCLPDVWNAIELGRRVVANIKENLFWAFFYNAIGIPLAAGVFYYGWGLKLEPVFAAAAMGLSSICVVLNALRVAGRTSSRKHTADTSFSRASSPVAFGNRGR